MNAYLTPFGLFNYAVSTSYVT